VVEQKIDTGAEETKRDLKMEGDAEEAPE